jgi:EAL domain-containing protein (putative c-di-GMP-specific phosphodiesterase class I)
MLRHDIPAALIALELTESSMVDEDSVAPEELRQLRAMGIELQIDDFGTGYSSLSQLQRLDIDVVKIDQSFVRKLGQDQQSNALCEAIISIGRALNITVVAEGVETQEQLNILRQMGCEEVQGYLLSRPVLPEKIAQLLLQGPFFEVLRLDAP